MARNGFENLFLRLQHRLIRSIDVASIVILDAVILLLAYGLLRLVNEIVVDGGELFRVVTVISEIMFLLLYVIWVVADLQDVIKRM